MNDKEYMSDKEYVANISNMSNKKLIDGLEWCGHDNYYNVMYYPILKEIKKRLSKERKTGKWQRRKGSDCWECSECHAVMESDDFVRHNFYYCYHCGADMMNEDGYMRLEGTDHE